MFDYFICIKRGQNPREEEIKNQNEHSETSKHHKYHLKRSLGRVQG